MQQPSLAVQSCCDPVEAAALSCWEQLTGPAGDNAGIRSTGHLMALCCKGTLCGVVVVCVCQALPDLAMLH